MADIRDTQDQAIRKTIREERARDAARALREVETARHAALAKTARLRALRLAREAGDDQQP